MATSVAAHPPCRLLYVNDRLNDLKFNFSVKYPVTVDLNGLGKGSSV